MYLIHTPPTNTIFDVTLILIPLFLILLDPRTLYLLVFLILILSLSLHLTLTRTLILTPTLTLIPLSLSPLMSMRNLSLMLLT